MLPLMEMLTKGGNGAAMDAIARQFGVSREQAEQAAAALMPAFSQGLKRNTADPMGFLSFMQAMASGNHLRYFEDPARAASGNGIAEGNASLGHLFGSKELSRAVAAQAAQATGLSQSLLKQMLPALAPILMGGLFQQMTDRPGGGSQGENPLGRMLEQMMGGNAGRMPNMPGSGGNPLGEIFEQMLGGSADRRGGVPGDAPQAGSGNPWMDMLGQMMGGGGEAGRAGGRDMPVPGSDNPLGKMFEQMMGGGGAPQATRQEAPPPAPGGTGGSGFEQIFGQMFDAGRSAQGEYQKNMEQLFDQFLKGRR